MSAIADMLTGALIMGCLVVSLIFLRFYRRTRDRLFAMFAAAFVSMAATRLFLLTAVDPNARTPVYIARLVTFMLILLAIIDKNRASGSTSAPK